MKPCDPDKSARRPATGPLDPYDIPQARIELLRAMLTERGCRPQGPKSKDSISERVFVLGAGFSACVGLPLAGNFFAKWMQWLQRMDDKGIRSLQTRIRLFAYTQLSEKRGWHAFDRTGWHEKIDIERLLTLAEATAGLWKVISAKDDVGRGLADVHKLLPEYFRRSVGIFLYAETMMPDRSWFPVIDFCERLRLGDTVVTFNWDTVVETGLTAIGAPYDLSGGGRAERISILKLHGSIDWFSGKLPIQEAAQFTAPVIRNISRVTNYPPFNDLAGDWFVPYLVPPTAYKRYERGILALWKKASAAIFKARQVFAVGYSMPPTDWASVSLLRLPFRPEVTDPEGRRSKCRELIVVNPSLDVANRFKLQIFPRCRCIPKKVEEMEWSRYI